MRPFSPPLRYWRMPCSPAKTAIWSARWPGSTRRPAGCSARLRRRTAKYCTPRPGRTPQRGAGHTQPRRRIGIARAALAGAGPTLRPRRRRDHRQGLHQLAQGAGHTGFTVVTPLRASRAGERDHIGGTSGPSHPVTLCASPRGRPLNGRRERAAPRRAIQLLPVSKNTP